MNLSHCRILPRRKSNAYNPCHPEKETRPGNRRICFDPAGFYFNIVRHHGVWPGFSSVSGGDGRLARRRACSSLGRQRCRNADDGQHFGRQHQCGPTNNDHHSGQPGQGSDRQCPGDKPRDNPGAVDCTSISPKPVSRDRNNDHASRIMGELKC